MGTERSEGRGHERRRRIRDEGFESRRHARIDEQLVGPQGQAAVHQRRPRHERQRPRVLLGAARLGQVDLEDQPACVRCCLVGLVEAVDEAVAEQAPDNALRIDPFDRPGDEGRVVDALVGTAHLDQQGVSLVDPQRVVERGVVLGRPIADGVREAGWVPAERGEHRLDQQRLGVGLVADRPLEPFGHAGKASDLLHECHGGGDLMPKQAHDRRGLNGRPGSGTSARAAGWRARPERALASGRARGDAPAAGRRTAAVSAMS
jgi:hypothetical protein